MREKKNYIVQSSIQNLRIFVAESTNAVYNTHFCINDIHENNSTHTESVAALTHIDRCSDGRFIKAHSYKAKQKWRRNCLFTANSHTSQYASQCRHRKNIMNWIESPLEIRTFFCCFISLENTLLSHCSTQTLLPLQYHPYGRSMRM